MIVGMQRIVGGDICERKTYACCADDSGWLGNQ